MKLPEPKERPLSEQVERVCMVTLGVGVGLMVPTVVLDGQVGRELLIGGVACLITIAPAALYQAIQSIRWQRRSES